jgi:D-alanine-D-alanine ligase
VTINSGNQKSIIFPPLGSTDEDAKHVAVLMGGFSEEREVSLMSGKGVVEHLVKLGYKVTPIDMGRDIARALSEVRPDVVFNALHGQYGEDGCVQGMLEILGIPYTHSGVLASAIALDKIHSQDLFMANGILCPKRKIISKNDYLQSDPMPRPYVIKPINLGSSIGIILVFEGDEFEFNGYDFPHGNKVIIEEYIPGREIQVAVFGERARGPLEIELLKRRFYDYDSKYTEGFARHILPAKIDPKAAKEVLAIALKVHKLIDCKGATRVEFRYNDQGDGRFYLLEINTHPGFTPLSIVPEILESAGISFTKLVGMLVEEAEYESVIKKEKV